MPAVLIAARVAAIATAGSKTHSGYGPATSRYPAGS
jgi:hypothetical protein